jgi:hypothetical protein
MQSNDNPTLQSLYGKGADSKDLGIQVLRDGPFNTSGRAKGKGRSSGSKGMILNLDKLSASPLPITQRAKGKY